jgi:hypothetical protein
MPIKDPEKRKAYQRAYTKKHYKKYRAKHIARNKRLKAELRAEVAEIKEANPCMDCGEKYPACVMDFDHRDPSLKKDRNHRVSELAARGARKKVFEEIEKCDLVCANCHRIRTHMPL